MTSFIPIISLFLLVLASGYYTAPVVDETTSLYNEPGRETTEAPEHNTRSSPDDMDPEATSPEDATEENNSQGLRSVPNNDEDESGTPTTPQATNEIQTSTSTLKSTTEKTSGQHQSGSQSNGGESGSESKSGRQFQQRGMLDVTTTTSTSTMSSQSISSSTTIPEVNSTSSTSTVKHTGFLKDQPTDGNRPDKTNKPPPKPEDPTATLGTDILQSGSALNLSGLQDNTMQMDDNTNSPVTVPIPTTMEGKPKQPKTSLNEGQKSSQSEEEK